MNIKTSVIALFYLLISAQSCTNDLDNSKSVLTFDDVEKEFSFKTPLSEKSKNRILLLDGSVDLFRTNLIDRKKFLEMNKPNALTGKSAAAKNYRVQIWQPTNGTHTYLQKENIILLEVAEEHGYDLPYSCRAGKCSSCAGRLFSGLVDQSQQQFLNYDQIDRGFILTCVAYPKSDVDYQTNMEVYL
nr:2Fe-2S iron-sulfur cluster-binding protein [uncultured Chryseobacterium sp.]